MSDAVADTPATDWKAWAFSLIHAAIRQYRQPKNDSQNKLNKEKPMKKHNAKSKTAKNINLNLGCVKEIWPLLFSWLP